MVAATTTAAAAAAAAAAMASECFNIQAPLRVDAADHLGRPERAALSARSSGFKSTTRQCHMTAPARSQAPAPGEVAAVAAAAAVVVPAAAAAQVNGGAASEPRSPLPFDRLDALEFAAPQLDSTVEAAARATRVAFATADIRRALAKLAQRRAVRRDQSVGRPRHQAHGRPVAAFQQEDATSGGGGGGGGDGGSCGRPASAWPAATAAAAGAPSGALRRFKITQDRGGRAGFAIFIKDDLCPSAERESSFCPLTAPTTPNKLAGRRRQQQQQQRPRITPPARQQKVFISSGDCGGERACEQRALGRQELEVAHGAGLRGRKSTSRQPGRQSGSSISMNHLNEIKTSAAAICCASLRTRRSYGLSDILTSDRADDSGEPRERQGRRQQSWFSRISSAPTTIAAGGSSEQTKSDRQLARKDRAVEEKFVLRRSSIDFETTEELEDRLDHQQQQQQQQAKGSESEIAQVEHCRDLGMASLASGNQIGASMLEDELRMHASELRDPGGSSLSVAAAAAAVAAASAAQANGSNGLNGSNKNLSKLVGKKAARLKELVLQNLGKADRTQDELFDLYELNFYKQQQQVSKLTKEFKAYLAALKHFHEAGRSLNKCIQQSTSDYQSARHDLVCETLSQLDALNEDLLEKLHEQVVKQVGEYLSEFGEMKAKISKRHRKLIDYDKSRRLYELMLAQLNKRRARQNQALTNGAEGADSGDSENYHSILRGLKFLSQQQQQQQSQQQQQQQATLSSQQEFIASQLVDEARLLKFREQFNLSKLMYESINGELHDELPIVYEKKMKSLLTALQSYFAIEAHYHSNAGKLVGTVSEVIDEMPNCVGGQQQALAARKLSGDHEDGHHLTILGRNQGEDDEVDANEDDDEGDDDDDDDDDSYESGSSSADSTGPGRRHRHETVGGAVGDKPLSAAHVGGSSSGLGSSRGDSSCSVGSSSPDCPIHEDQAEATLASMASNGDSGKAPAPADCSTAGAAAVAKEATGQQPTVQSVGSVEGVAAAAAAAMQAAGPVESSEKSAVVAATEDHASGAKEPQSSTAASVQDELGPTSESGANELINQQPRSDEFLPGVLYKVRTNYKYLAEDVDELCFESDEIIQVVEFDENQEPEEGWLMGVREINGQRGLFPANFTQPI